VKRHCFVGQTIQYSINNSFLNVTKKCPFVYSIFLNRQVPINVYKRIFAISKGTYVADGGANYIYDSLQQEEKTSLIPNAIIGDFDSIRSEVINYYQLNGSDIVHTTNQNTSDLQKVAYYVFDQVTKHYNLSKENPLPKLILLIVGAFGGRMDHTLSNLHSLQKLSILLSKSQLFTEFQI